MIRKIFEKITKIAPLDMPVLISGEHGTYKELVARAIHDHSPRSERPFIELNFDEIPIELARNEFSASQAEIPREGSGQIMGKITEADGGTLFIQEISRIDDSLKANLALLIRDKEIRLSDQNVIRSDVRIIATTNRNIGNSFHKGDAVFDLFRNYSGVLFRIPPLRERADDILPLAYYFADEAQRKFETPKKEFSKDAKDFLMNYEWPGNIRELETMIKRATILCRGNMIEKKDFFIADIGSCSIREFLEEKLKRYLREMTKLESCNLYDTVLSEVERSLIAIVLQETKGNQFKTAKTLGINRNTLRSKIKEYKLRV